MRIVANHHQYNITKICATQTLLCLIFSIKTANAGGLTYWDYPSGEGHSITTNPNKETVMKSGLFKEVSIYC